MGVYTAERRRNYKIAKLSLNTRPGGAMVARLTLDHKIAGSNPAMGDIFLCMVVSKIISFGLGRFSQLIVSNLNQFCN